MDFAGLVLSTVAIAGLFNNAVQCFEYVKLGQDFKLDFKTSQSNLCLAQKRLTRWGQALGLDRVASEEQNFPINRSSDEDRRQVAHILSHLISLFNKAKEQSKSYHDHPSNADSPFSTTTVMIEPLKTSVLAKLNRMSISFVNRAISKSMEQTKWALHGNQAITKLVNDIIGLVTQLEIAFPPPADVYKQIVSYEVEEVTEDETDETLTQIQATAAVPQSGGPPPDPALAEGLERKIAERKATVYINNTVKGKDAKVQQGNVVTENYTGQFVDTGSTYKGNLVDGNEARVMYGTTFGGKGLWD